MRPTACLLLLACGCGDPRSAATNLEAPTTITAITYNMFFGIAADLVPESTSPGHLSASATALLNGVALTDYRCRIEGDARLLLAEQPDVIGLQEALLVAYTRDLDHRDDDDILVDFVAELVQAIERDSGLRYRAFVRDNTIIADQFPIVGGVRLVDRVAILVHPRFSTAFQADSLTFHTLEPASDFVPTGTGQIVRGALHVRVPFTAGALDVYSTHLQSGAAAQVRAAQAEELAAFIGSTSEPDSTIVLAGDLNDVPGSPTYAAVAAGLVDTYGLAGAPPGFTAYQTQTLVNPMDEATMRIDYVFARSSGVDQSQVIANQMIGPCNLWPSDHFGVVSRIRTGASPLPNQP